MVSILSLPLSLHLRQPVDDGTIKHVHATGRTGLLALEPRLQAGRVEDVRTGQLLAARHHFFTAYDADIVDCFQFRNGGIGIAANTTTNNKLFTCSLHVHVHVHVQQRNPEMWPYRVFRCRMACCEAITS